MRHDGEEGKGEGRIYCLVDVAGKVAVVMKQAASLGEVRSLDVTLALLLLGGAVLRSDSLVVAVQMDM